MWPLDDYTRHCFVDDRTPQQKAAAAAQYQRQRATNLRCEAERLDRKAARNERLATI